MSKYLLSLRNRHFFFIDALILLATPTLALLLQSGELSAIPDHRQELLGYTVVALVIRQVVFYQAGLYRRYWAYASADELYQVGIAVIISTILIALVAWFISLFTLPAISLSALFIDALLVLVFVGGARFSVRLSSGHRHSPSRNSRRTLIFGAGDAGEMILREMKSIPDLGYYPVAFLDDDPKKHNIRIHGLLVLGGRKDLVRVISTRSINCVVIAMPSVPGDMVRDIVDTCKRIRVETKVVPALSEILNGRVTISQLRDVAIDDLLRRDPVRTDTESVSRLLAGRRVLVTGGGGSIGRELCRQILYCAPLELIILGHGENAIFETHHELRRLKKDRCKITPVIADTRFPQRVLAVFEEFQPQFVFHAAAHKHVPLMESNPAEAITNNVWSTAVLLDASLATGVARFVMISTDKAVNPTSIMGASKRVAEMLVYRAAKEHDLPYVAVRFGNVLGSCGSAILTFKRQIESGGPVTITHPAVNRYFMTIPEAVQLVLQAAVLGEGGEVFVLDMGQPIKIVDLACDMIRLSGLKPEVDIAVEYIGLRPGEKLSEELFAVSERHGTTRHEKIFIAINGQGISDQFETALEALLQSAQQNDRERIIENLRMLVPEYQSA
jgi:FlaA1/EpsC-like NDP-sugar epimerase